MVGQGFLGKTTFGGKSGSANNADDDKKLYKYSVYMQSRDSKWLNRNIQNNKAEDDPEPIEEDIRD